MKFNRVCVKALASLAVILAAFSAVSAEPAGPARANAKERAMLKTLKAGHPRVLFTGADLDRVRALLEIDAGARSARDTVLKQADDIFPQKLVEHVLIGPRLLSQSRRALWRVQTLGMAYHLTGERKYFDRARREMLAAAGFPDWNPAHFLDTAEMTNALGIGYDCFYDELSPEDRAVIRNAIVKNGLLPGLSIYEKKFWWTASAFNWNQVCNGGMLVGALAIAGEEPDLAARIVSFAVNSLPIAMKSYAPDGAWAEGPGYWGYATSYNVYALAALHNALGTDFGLSNQKGFADCGMFRLHCTGPFDRAFNFADSAEVGGKEPVLFWLSRRFNKPLYAWMERAYSDEMSALDLLWYDPRGIGPKSAHVPLDAFFTGVNCVFMRSAWEDPNALFVGFKGGDNAANHSHLDLGTFVLDALGQRWVVDLGRDDYNLPGYWDIAKERWSYYRLATAGQNTLSLNAQNQSLTAKGPITAFSSSPDAPFAIADLSAGYKGIASSVRRGLAMPGRRSVIVQDEISAPEPVDISWRIHTRASVSANGKTAILSQEGRTLEARLLEPRDASFVAESAAQEPPQNPNTGVTRLVVKLPGKQAEARIVVQFTPVQKGSAPDNYTVIPLSRWSASAKHPRSSD